MNDWAMSMVWIVLFVTVLIYNIYRLKNTKDPKEELLKAKQLLDQGLIASADYEKIKARLVKRITSEG